MIAYNQFRQTVRIVKRILLESERKRMSGDLAINATRSARAVFNKHHHREHAKCTRRTRLQLSTRHSECFQTEQLDFRLDRHLASRDLRYRTIRV